MVNLYCSIGLHKSVKSNIRSQCYITAVQNCKQDFGSNNQDMSLQFSLAHSANLSILICLGCTVHKKDDNLW